MLHVEIENLLRSRSLRVTPFRVKVLEVFQKNQYAIDLSKLEKSLKTADRITLYRTLKTFIEAGLIHEIAMPGDIRKLALCKEECEPDHAHHHQHMHFRCDSCEQIFCLNLEEFPQIKYPKFKIRQLEIQGNGLCAGCR